jgi:hypothetical protein
MTSIDDLPLWRQTLSHRLDEVKERMTQSSKIILGIDPGANGGMALLQGNDACTWKLPETEDDFCNLIEEIQASFGQIDLCVVEKQIAMPLQNVAATGKQMQGYGFIRGLLAGLKIRREFVRAQDWQKLLGIPPRRKEPEETHTEWKNRLKQKAQELFPGLTIILAVSDALLIAEAGRRMQK